VGFVVDKVALEQVSPSAFRFYPVSAISQLYKKIIMYTYTQICATPKNLAVKGRSSNTIMPLKFRVEASDSMQKRENTCKQNKKHSVIKFHKHSCYNNKTHNKFSVNTHKPKEKPLTKRSN
jgi:hypothetical protein